MAASIPLIQPRPNGDPERGDTSLIDGELDRQTGAGAGLHLGNWLEVGIGRALVVTLKVTTLGAGQALSVQIDTAASDDGSDPYGVRTMLVISKSVPGPCTGGAPGYSRFAIHNTDRYIRARVVGSVGSASDYVVSFEGV